MVFFILNEPKDIVVTSCGKQHRIVCYVLFNGYKLPIVDRGIECTEALLMDLL